MRVQLLLLGIYYHVFASLASRDIVDYLSNLSLPNLSLASCVRRQQSQRVTDLCSRPRVLKRTAHHIIPRGNPTRLKLPIDGIRLLLQICAPVMPLIASFTFVTSRNTCIASSHSYRQCTLSQGPYVERFKHNSAWWKARQDCQLILTGDGYCVHQAK